MCLDSAWTAEFSKIDYRHDPMASMEQRPRQPLTVLSLINTCILIPDVKTTSHPTHTLPSSQTPDRLVPAGTWRTPGLWCPWQWQWLAVPRLRRIERLVSTRDGDAGACSAGSKLGDVLWGQRQPTRLRLRIGGEQGHRALASTRDGKGFWGLESAAKVGFGIEGPGGSDCLGLEGGMGGRINKGGRDCVPPHCIGAVVETQGGLSSVPSTAGNWTQNVSSSRRSCDSGSRRLTGGIIVAMGTLLLEAGPGLMFWHMMGRGSRRCVGQPWLAVVVMQRGRLLGHGKKQMGDFCSDSRPRPSSMKRSAGAMGVGFREPKATATLTKETLAKVRRAKLACTQHRNSPGGTH